VDGLDETRIKVVRFFTEKSAFLIFCMSFVAPVALMIIASYLHDRAMTASAIFMASSVVLANSVVTVWVWSIGERLTKNEIVIGMGFKKRHINIVLLGIIVFIFMSTFMFDAFFITNSETNVPFNSSLMIIQNIFVILFISGFVYLLYVASKCILIIESRQSVNIFDYISMMIAFMFFPITVWGIQRRVKQCLGQ